ncbi:MAG: spore cortex biosynthesis protein YabQ [Erysipelotrichales bacterium]|nr:spore cortex biosynthesis protein YabQ [Erysipelotrichales bacterium]
MDLLVQFQSLFYSFVYGFVMSGVYHIINRFLYKVPLFIRFILQIGIGIVFGFLYFYGLVVINDGILRFYFFIMIFIGYLFYQKYYAYYLLYYLEKIVFLIKRICSPFFFFFHKISVIIQKRVRKVKKKWQKNKDNQDLENS